MLYLSSELRRRPVALGHLLNIDQITKALHDWCRILSSLIRRSILSTSDWTLSRKLQPSENTRRCGCA